MFCFSPNIYATNFNGTIILLDAKNDSYVTLNDYASKTIRKLFSKAKLNSNQRDVVQDLIEAGFIVKTRLRDCNIATTFLKEPKKKGIANIDWRMPYGNLNKKANLCLFCEAYFTLIQVNYLLKKHKIAGIIKKLKACSNKTLKHTAPQPLIEELCIALDKACFYFPKRIKCLIWAATLALMCLRKKINATFKIGVQNYPFLAHAWVEIDNKVIADDPYVKQGLAVIFSSGLNV